MSRHPHAVQSYTVEYEDRDGYLVEVTVNARTASDAEAKVTKRDDCVKVTHVELFP